MHNCEVVINQICELQNVPVTRSTIKKNVEEHPDFSTLLSVRDILNHLGFETLSLKIGFSQIKELPVPFIAQIKGTQNVFTVIKEINEKIKR